MKRPGDALLALLRRVLDADDVARVIEPTIADARERWAGRDAGGDAPPPRWAAGAVLVDVVRALAALALDKAWSTARATQWWLLVPALAAAFAGAVGLRDASGTVALANAHLAFVGAGVALGAAVAVAPARALAFVARYVAPVALLVALGAVAWAGTAYEGARRWIAVGDLRVHVAELAHPVFVLAAASLAARARRGPLVGFCALVLALLVLEPDFDSTLLYAFIALFVAWPTRARSATAAVSGAALVIAAAREPAMMPVRHAEGALAAMAAGRPAAFALAALALITWCAVTAIATATAARDASRRSDAFAAAMARGLAAALVLGPVVDLVGQRGMRLVSYGGSSSIATLVAAGLLLRLVSRTRRQPHAPSA